MPDNDKDDLHEALARMADGVESEVAEQSEQPADLPVSDSRENEAPVSLQAQPARSAPGAIRAAFPIVLLIVGGLLLGWTVYGTLILTGAVVVDRDDARSMAGLMVFAGGPLGLILITAGVIGLRNWFKARAAIH